MPIPWRNSLITLYDIQRRSWISPILSQRTSRPLLTEIIIELIQDNTNETVDLPENRLKRSKDSSTNLNHYKTEASQRRQKHSRIRKKDVT